METTGNFNILTFVVSVAVYFVIGWIWYGNQLFSRAWVRETGISMEGKTAPILPMVGQLISSILYTFGIYMIIMLGKFTGLQGGLIAALSIIGFFIIPINAGILLFQKKHILFLIDAGYQSVGAIAVSLILALWK